MRATQEAIWVLAATAAWTAPEAGARTLRVPEDFPAIQPAIDAAADGDEIVIDEGTYRENLFIVGKTITVRSAGCPCRVIVDGGGTDAVLTLDAGGRSTIDGLKVRNGRAPHGGGIRIFGPTPALIRRTCCEDNAADIGGGGIAILGGPGEARIENTLIARNRAVEGAGIYIEGPVTPVIVNDTIVENEAEIGAGGIVNRDGEPAIFNTILWMNRAGGDLRDIEGLGPTMIGFSTIGDGQFAGVNGNDAEDPLFQDPAAGNYLLGAGSPAIDAGVPTFGPHEAPDRDFEDAPRYDDPLAPNLHGGIEEKGMDEVSPAFIRGDSNADGVVDVADPIYTLSYIFGDGPDPKCLNAADANDSGGVDLADPIYTLAYLFTRGDPIPYPHPRIGLDRKPPELACDWYHPCGP